MNCDLQISVDFLFNGSYDREYTEPSPILEPAVGGMSYDKRYFSRDTE